MAQKPKTLLVCTITLSALVHAGLLWGFQSPPSSTHKTQAQGSWHKVTTSYDAVPQDAMPQDAEHQDAARQDAVPQDAMPQDPSASLAQREPQSLQAAQVVQVSKPSEASGPSLKLLRPQSLAEQIKLAAQREPSALPMLTGGGLRSGAASVARVLPAHLNLLSPNLPSPQPVDHLFKAQEFKYASYYLRMRQQLAAAWWPRVQKLIDMHIFAGQKALLQHRITQARIVLNNKGQLVGKVQLLKSCGLNRADRVALQALRAAAPFPNPPAALMKAEKQLPLVWHFVIHP